MTLSEFLSDSPVLTPDTVPTWKQRGVPAFDATAVLKKCSYLREQLAAFMKDHELDGTATITLTRGKIGDLGLGELLTLSTGERFAAVACAFRELDGDQITTIAVMQTGRKAKAAKAEETAAEAPAEKAPFTNEQIYAALTKAYEGAKPEDYAAPAEPAAQEEIAPEA